MLLEAVHGIVISIHAPRVGSDRYEDIMTVSDFNFNPRSPGGERLSITRSANGTSTISIHAPRVGSDSNRPRTGSRAAYFNPRSPGGERLAEDRRR